MWQTRLRCLLWLKHFLSRNLRFANSTQWRKARAGHKARGGGAPQNLGRIGYHTIGIAWYYTVVQPCWRDTSDPPGFHLRVRERLSCKWSPWSPSQWFSVFWKENLCHKTQIHFNALHPFFRGGLDFWFILLNFPGYFAKWFLVSLCVDATCQIDWLTVESWEAKLYRCTYCMVVYVCCIAHWFASVMPHCIGWLGLAWHL